jgi:dynein heavy chain
VNTQGWNFLLKGCGAFDREGMPQNPLPEFLPEVQWDLAYVFENAYEEMKGLAASFTKDKDAWEIFNFDDDPLGMEIPGGFNDVHPFLKLIIYKIFRAEKLLFAFSDYVADQMGKSYAESPPATVEALYESSDKKTPSIFVLSQGADPTGNLIKFGQAKGFEIDKNFF